MASKKYYAVKAGRQTGIFSTWEECQKQVLNFTNAEYKSFKTKEEARNYIFSIESVSKLREIDMEYHENEIAIAYSDGSYDDSNKSFSFGTLIIWNGEFFCFSQRFDTEEFASLRNVAGEILGAKKAMKFAQDNKIKKLQLHHDYEGVAAWAKGDWKANLDFTKKYVNFFNKISKDVQVEFVWVKGHSGNRFNDKVDQLAKDATFEAYSQKEVL